MTRVRLWLANLLFCWATKLAGKPQTLSVALHPSRLIPPHYVIHRHISEETSYTWTGPDQHQSPPHPSAAEAIRDAWEDWARSLHGCVR